MTSRRLWRQSRQQMPACCHTSGLPQSANPRAKAASESGACVPSAAALRVIQEWEIGKWREGDRLNFVSPSPISPLPIRRGTSIQPVGRSGVFSLVTCIRRCRSSLRRKSTSRPSLGSIRALDNCPINFFDVALAKLLRQPARRLRCPRQQYDARHGRVQPADDSQINIARLVILLPNVFLRHGNNDGRSSATPIVGSIAGLFTASK